MSAPRFQHRSAAYPMSASRRTDAGLDWKQDFMITPPVSKLYQAVSAFSASNRKVHHCWVAAEYCPFTWKQSQAPQRVSNLCHHTNSDRAGCPLSALPLCASPECAQLFPEHLPTCPLLQPKPEVASGKKSEWWKSSLPPLFIFRQDLQELLLSVLNTLSWFEVYILKQRKNNFSSTPLLPYLHISTQCSCLVFS